VPKIFDCFVFNDELELLELRLETSASIVDAFVLVEATKTFSGADKPLHYALNESRFSRWRDKLRHVVVDDMPLGTGRRWDAEVHQRNALLRGLDGAAENDVVLVSDADELVHPEVLLTLRSCRDLVGLEMPRAFHFANWNVPSSRFAIAARAMPYGRLEDPHRQRNHVSPDRVIRNAGHHFTSLGGVAALVRKFETYSHAEMDNEQQKAGAYLERAHEMGLDVFSRRLVSVTSPGELSELQLALLRRNPELFDFSGLPDLKLRRRFRWYAGWRARQDAGSDLVRELDRRYDVRPWRVRAVVVQEMLRHALWTFPRGLARTARNRLRELGSANPVPAREGS
jgi:Glycosyltransferase family 17